MHWSFTYLCHPTSDDINIIDCRWFSSVYFIVRFSFLLVGAVTLGVSYFIFCVIILTILVLITMIIVIQPFINAVFAIILALVYSFVFGYDRALLVHSTTAHYFLVFGVMVATSPLLYMIIVILYRAVGLIRRMRALRNGYEELTYIVKCQCETDK